MAYIGRSPARGQNREIDDISSSFNGSTTAFTLQSGGTNASPGSANQLFVNLGGVMQNPGTDFTVSNYTITFTTAPASGLSFWALIQGDSVDINTPADDSVTGAKLAVSLVAGDTLYASGTDTLARLPKGTDGQVLKLASGVPSWAADAQDSTLTTQGDILYRDGSGYARLAAGTSGHFLKTLGSGANPAWAAGGVSSDALSNTIGGTDAGANLDGSNATKNTFFGKDAGKLTDESKSHTAIGFEALATHSAAVGAGYEGNVAIGAQALKDSTSSYSTIAIGWQAGENVVGGYNNTLIGYRVALNGFITGNGHDNVGIGLEALKSATSCQHNVAIGSDAQESVTTGSYNVSVGTQSLWSATTGNENTAVGYYCAPTLTTGLANTFVGASCASTGTITGSDNVGMGTNAIYKVSTGVGNVVIGYKAGYEITTGGYNVCIGNYAGHGQITTQSKQLFIARANAAAGSNKTWIVGDSSGSCTQGDNTTSWTTTSDERLKKNIVDSTVGLSIIDNVKVRSFEYRTEAEIDRSKFTVTETKDEDGEFLQQLSLGHPGTRIGVIAQELETIAPKCIKTDDRGVKTVNSDDLFWNLITAVQELSTKNATLEADVTQLKTDNNSLVARVTALEAA
jgi:hypothetical protein